MPSNMSSSNGEPWVPEEESWPSSPLAGEDDVVIRCRTLASQEALHGAAYEAGTASSHAESVKLRHASVRAVRGVEAVQPEPAAARPCLPGTRARTSQIFVCFKAC
jgi:hypothetical protein